MDADQLVYDPEAGRRGERITNLKKLLTLVCPGPGVAVHVMTA
ncbi:hypothetical protein [Streptomyces sp. NPDC048411]